MSYKCEARIGKGRDILGRDLTSSNCRPIDFSELVEISTGRMADLIEFRIVDGRTGRIDKIANPVNDTLAYTLSMTWPII